MLSRALRSFMIKQFSLFLLLALLTGCQLTQTPVEEEKPEKPVETLPLAESDDPVLLQPPSPEELYLWHHMRAGFALPQSKHKSVHYERSRYLRHKDILAEINSRAGDYLFLIVDALEENEMPLELALLPFVESGFDPYAYSHGGAVGLWQFMPSTGKRFGLQQDWWFDGRRDINASTHAAIAYLKYLNKMFKGDWLLAVAAYNSGEGRVRRAIAKNKRLNKPTDFFNLRLPAETRAYVPRLLAISDIVRRAEEYGLSLPQLPNEPLVTSVNVGPQIELAVIARLSGLKESKIAELNPGFNRWATSPDGEHSVLLPVSQQEQFLTSLANLPKKERLSWQRYQVKAGDSLGVIAQKHHTTVAVLKSANNLTGNLIRIGQGLLIPLHSEVRIPPKRKQRIEPIQYEVQTGDSLWLIANQFGISHKDIARWNGLSHNILRPGQKLAIYPKKAQPKTRTVKYKVRSGDSLSVIAKRFDVTVKSLKQWNNLRSDFLKIGQRLTIKVEVARG